MNSSQRRRQEADKHNYERWLYQNTRNQRVQVKPQVRRTRDRVMRSSVIATLVGMGVIALHDLD